MMMNKPSVPGWTKASRNTDPLSSHLAEDDVTRSGERQRQCDMVLAVVTANPGMTSKELTRYAPPSTDRYTFSRRLPDLEKKGLVQRGEMRKCSVGGKLSVTWSCPPRQAPLF